MSANDDSPLADTEVHYVQSEHVGAEFKIFVGHCGAPGPTPRAVLYVGDGNGLFASAVDIVRLMQLSAHLPPLQLPRVHPRRAEALGPLALPGRPRRFDVLRASAARRCGGTTT